MQGRTEINNSLTVHSDINNLGQAGSDAVGGPAQVVSFVLGPDGLEPHGPVGQEGCAAMQAQHGLVVSGRFTCSSNVLFTFN